MASSFFHLLFFASFGRTFLLFVAVMFASTSLPAATVRWNSDLSGFWSQAEDWTSNPYLPGTADDVVIDRATAALTVTHSSKNDSIKSLICNETFVLSGGTLAVAELLQINGGWTLSGGTLGGTGAVQVAGTMNWTAGTLSSGGGTSIAAGRSLTLSGNDSRYLNGASLSNAGTITQSGYGTFYGQGTNATISNLRGGLFDCQSNSSISTFTGSGQTFNNAGIFRKSAGIGSTKINWTFNNSGSLQVQTGKISLLGGGTHSGAFEVASAAKLEFSQGSHYFSGSTFSNLGTILLSGGTAYFNGPTTIPGAVTLTGLATIGKTSAVSFENLTWSGGTLAGSAAIPLGGNLAIRDGSAVRYLDGGSISNAGTVAWRGLNNINGQGYLARIDNLQTGVFDCQGDSSILTSSGLGHTFNNAGIFRKSAGKGTSVIDWGFVNTGTLEVQSGTLDLRRGLTGAGTTIVSGKGVTLIAPSLVQDTLIIGSVTAMDMAEPESNFSAVPEPSAWIVLLSAAVFWGCRQLGRWRCRCLL